MSLPNQKYSGIRRGYSTSKMKVEEAEFKALGKRILA